MMDGVNSLVATAPAAATAPAGSATKSAAKSARDFESVFVGQMTKMMMETVETQGEISGGHGEEMFRGVLAEKLGGAISARGGIGLAPAVMKQIVALQEAAGQKSGVQTAAGPNDAGRTGSGRTGSGQAGSGQIRAGQGSMTDAR